MGFFSDDYKSCGHPLLSEPAVTKGVNDWLTEGVSISPRGGVLVGAYDGFGRLAGAEESVGSGENSIWHRAGC